MDNIYKILKNFSFSEPEISVYLAVLRLGKPNVTEIAYKANMGRTAAYFHIKNLVDQGYLKEIKKGSKYHYSAEQPEELLSGLKKQVSKFQQLVPELEKLQKIENEVPLIEVKESLPALTQIYDDIANLPVNSEFRVLQGKKGMTHELATQKREYWGEFFNKIVNNKIITKAIFTEEGLDELKKTSNSGSTKKIKERIWVMKTLPEEVLPFDELIYLYANKVVFMFPDASMVVFIKHRRIFQAMKAMFDALHNFAQTETNPWE